MTKYVLYDPEEETILFQGETFETRKEAEEHRKQWIVKHTHAQERFLQRVGRGALDATDRDTRWQTNRWQERVDEMVRMRVLTVEYRL